MSRALAVINFLSTPVDPGYGIPGGPGPDNSLPPFQGGPGHDLPGIEGPVDPGYGYPLPPVVDNGLPPVHGHPGHRPPRPDYPVDPDYGLPITPGIWPKPPLGTWPPPQPIYPSHPIYILPPHPDQGLPGDQPHPDHGLPSAPGQPTHPIEMPPGSVWPPLPPAIQGKILAFCWLVGIGYRWIVIDPSLKPGFPSNPGERPDQGLPPVHARPGHDLPLTPEPKK
jgi:hypothetical protein